MRDAMASPRTRSARLTLLSLLLIPLLSLAALWALTASIALGNVIRYQHYNTIITTIGPGVTELEETLPVERALTLVWLATGRQPGLFQAELTADRHNTDKYVPMVRSEVTQVRGLLGAKAVTLMNVFLADLADLGQIRAAVDSGTYDPVAAFNAYSVISTAEIQFFQNASPPSDPQLGLMTQSALAESRAQDATGGAISLIAGAITAHGIMTQPERVLFAQQVGEQNQEIGDTFSLADPALTALYQQVYDLPAYRALQTTETQIENSPVGRPIPVDAAAFQLTAQTIQKAVMANGAQIGVVLAAQSTHLRNSTVTELVLAAGLGLLAVAASIFVMVRFGRRLGVELSNLNDSAREMADERLPRLVDQLRRGEDVDVESESPPMKPSRITEIAIVARALSSVRRTALEAAVGQASLRKGINKVFVNLSLRNQSLLHRQLGTLDTMERATSDPAVLADLFRLDHLTTRMRRHAEGLLILAGTTPGRGWRDPVPVADVLQAAVAEIEDYVRVDVIADTADAVIGNAVNDVIHLIAELVENATAFSPPTTRVTVTGGIVGRGYAVEIEDRGLGMTPEAMAAVNEQLASPPEFDLANSEQLGLFVAGQLAARHGIRVTLRQNPYGGISAIVLLPTEIITSETEESSWFGPGGGAELPPPAVNGSAHEAGPAMNGSAHEAGPAMNGSAHEAGPAGDRNRGQAFGMTGRHRLAPSSPVTGGQANGGPRADGVAVPELPPAEPPIAAAAAVAAGWTNGSAAPAGITEPVNSPGPDEANGSAGGSGAAGSPGVKESRPGQAGNGAAGGGTYRGLPRRVRRANLAPQLLDLLGTAHAAAPRQALDPAGRSPEQTGSLMSAMQAGWLRGRLDDLDSPDAGLDVPGGRPADTSDGDADSDDREGES
jgi:signal transduction histidine kinase